MKVVILAGGFGTRLEEETINVPKPLVYVGEYPMIWHILKIYSSFGFSEFIICLGYKGFLIKEYFANYFLHHSDVTFDFAKGNGQMIIHEKKAEAWKVTLVDTGLETQTGGRIRRIKPYVGDETFMLSYGDIVADVDIRKLVTYHKSHKKVATVTAVQPPGKWGSLKFNQQKQVLHFDEKPAGDGGWINGGFFVLDSRIFHYLKEGDRTIWEREPLENLTKDNQLMVYPHEGFWQCMDTLRHKRELEKLWNDGHAPWQIWKKT